MKKKIKPKPKTKTKTKVAPTVEQAAVISAILAGESFITSALAGSGKTTTVIQAVVKLAKREGPTKADRLLLVAFNVKVAYEIKEKLEAALGRSCEAYGISVRTFNSLGHGTLLANRYGKGELTLDIRKTRDIVDELISTENGKRALLECMTPTAKKHGAAGMRQVLDQLAAILDLAKTYGVMPGRFAADPGFAAKLVEAAAKNAEAKSLIAPNKRLSSILRSCLLLNNSLAKNDGLIDYNDQPYLAVTQCSFIGRRWQTVIVDEMQDVNGLGLEQVKRACTKQLVLVGDKHQNIYASLRGANYAEIEKLAAERKLRTLELTTTFRCPRMIAARQTHETGNGPLKRFVPVAGAKMGAVSYPFFNAEARKTASGPTHSTAVWTFASVNAALKTEGLTSAKDTLSIITATNADLTGALALLCAERNCKARDLPNFFYRGVMYPAGMWNAAYRKVVAEPTNIDKLPKAMNLFCHVTGQTPEEAAADIAACADLSRLKDARWFAGTVHVQKGLEYDHVLVVNGPTFFGQTELRYVAETRSRNTLIGVDLCLHKLTAWKPKPAPRERAMIAFFGSQREAAEARPMEKGKGWNSATFGTPATMAKIAKMNIPKGYENTAKLIGPVKINKGE